MADIVVANETEFDRLAPGTAPLEERMRDWTAARGQVLIVTLGVAGLMRIVPGDPPGIAGGDGR